MNDELKSGVLCHSFKHPSFPRRLCVGLAADGPSQGEGASLAMRVFEVLAILLLIQSLVSLRSGFSYVRYLRASLRRRPGDYRPRTAVIIPVKGIDNGFDLNVSAFLAQDYPSYQLIFAVASSEDAAHDRLIQLVTARPLGSQTKDLTPEGAEAAAARATVLVAGHSEARGEKVHNLLQGLARVGGETEVLVFADIDARPKLDWLRSLVAPLADPAVTVSTGFRWYLPGHGFTMRLRAAWDTTVATMLGDHGQNFAWGGSMAIRAADFKRLRIAQDYWARTVSDDYALTLAVRDARGKIRFEPRCLVASRENSSFGDFFRWATRQVVLTRVYNARLWWMGFASYMLYAAPFLLGLPLIVWPSFFSPASSPATVRAGVPSALALILAFGMAKAATRTVVARELFPEERESLARYGSCYWRLSMLVPWIMLANFLVSAFTRRIEWRGTVYDLQSSGEIRIVRRSR
jgi:ceramide glucosyltransferase